MFPHLLEKQKPVFGYVSSPYWLDIGTIEKYVQAHFDILKGELKIPVPGKKLKQSVWAEKNTSLNAKSVIEGRLVIGHNTRIEEFVKISGLVSIGSNCKIKKGAQISDSVILDNTVIGEGAKVEKTIIGRNCNIEPNSILTSGCAIGDNSLISRFSNL